MEPRNTIVKAFAEWTAYSATRAGWPRTVKKDRCTVYPLIRAPDYDELLTRNHISVAEFDEWHQESTSRIRQKAASLPIGWATKLINVYLKTRVYLAGDGSPQLADVIHPPIDGFLWAGIKREYGKDPEILRRTHVVSRIKDICDHSTYETIIKGCRMISDRRRCKLIEVDQLWRGTEV